MSDVSAQNRSHQGALIPGFDHGWPWLLAGLMLLVSAGVFPSEGRLETERASVETLKAERVHALRVVEAYEVFLQGIDDRHETVVKRLAAAQLGIMPREDQPLAMLTGLQEPPTRWIERSVMDHPGPPVEPFVNDSLLATILGGEGRVWLFGGAILAIFIGLLLDRGQGIIPSPSTAPVEP